MKAMRSDKVFYIFDFLILTLCFLLVFYPLYFIVISSFSDPVEVNLGKVSWRPVGVTWLGYNRVLEDSRIWTGYRNTVLYTIVGTLINLILVMVAGFAMSRKELKGRGIIMGFFAFTMFFGGGMIPTYLLIRDLNMLDTIWALVLPGAFSVYNTIIVRTFISQNIPEEFWEASQIDGCGYFRYFLQIVIPLSGAVIAVMVLFFAVGHWNSYFAAMIYLDDSNKFPLQLVLRSILLSGKLQNETFFDSEAAAQAYAIAESMKYAVIIISSLPVLILYPFVQKYFVRGVMVGAIKG